MVPFSLLDQVIIGPQYRVAIHFLFMFSVSFEVMSYTEKIDVLELLISILQDHERKLDEIVARLEAVYPLK